MSKFQTGKVVKSDEDGDPTYGIDIQPDEAGAAEFHLGNFKTFSTTGRRIVKGCHVQWENMKALREPGDPVQLEVTEWGNCEEKSFGVSESVSEFEQSGRPRCWLMAYMIRWFRRGG